MLELAILGLLQEAPMHGYEIRKELATKLPGNILADYDRILRARAGLALVPVTKPNFCGACRMTITPQRLQELRAQSSLIPCESCGRYIYWPS